MLFFHHGTAVTASHHR